MKAFSGLHTVSRDLLCWWCVRTGGTADDHASAGPIQQGKVLADTSTAAQPPAPRLRRVVGGVAPRPEHFTEAQVVQGVSCKSVRSHDTMVVMMISDRRRPLASRSG